MFYPTLTLWQSPQSDAEEDDAISLADGIVHHELASSGKRIDLQSYCRKLTRVQ